MKHSSNSSSITRSLKWNTHYKHNINRFEAVKNILDDIYKAKYGKLDHYHQFPHSVLNLIGNYDCDETVEFAFDRVMKEFKISEKEIKNLDFYSNKFANEFHLVLPIFIMFKSEYHPSNYSLSRLVFKWIIHVRQVNSDNDEQFKKILEPIKFICPFIFELAIIYLIPSPPPPNSKSKLIFKYLISSKITSYSNLRLALRDLIYFESCDYHSEIFPLFASAVEYSYGKGGEGEGEEERSRFCGEFEIKFFNGNYNKNVILKYLIFLYDPRNWMRECILKRDPHLKNLFKFPPSTVPITLEYIQNLRTKGPDSKVEYIEFANRITFEYILSNDIRISIPSNLDFLVRMLRTLKSLELLEKGILDKIFKFKMMDGSPQWTLKEFGRLLSSSNLNHRFFYHGEIDEYLQLLDSPPLKVKRMTLFDALSHIQVSLLSNRS